MYLAPGTVLGAYEVVALLGAGGMGEVYRARDARLGREVAIKVLPPGFAADPDRLRRFEQEARAAAALSHPNILAVHDIGTQPAGASGDVTPYIVSELLEGQTLRERLHAHPVAVRKAIEYAVQMARGLAAAHEKGIVHRDLKPENVFVTNDGRVKILDFGLAKLTQAEVLSGVSELPTTPGAGRNLWPDSPVGAPHTVPGIVLGTLGYMSPEQVRGRAADHRSDIFALGAIVYEMLSGQRAFRGDTAADAMTAILKDDPPDFAADLHVPPGLARLVDRCLEKNPSARFQSTGDLAFALEATSSHGLSEPLAAIPQPRQLRGRIAAGIVGVAVLAGAALAGVASFTRVPTDVRVYRTGILPPDGATVGHQTAAALLAVSPDGRRLAFTALDTEGHHLLWVQTLETGVSQPLPGTDGAGYPFWSPDSRFIGFTAAGLLKKVDVSGGTPFTICDAPGGLEGSWNADDVIIFAGGTPGKRVIWRVPAAGGEPAPVTTIDAEAGDNRHLAPFFLPDGRHFLYFVAGSKANGPNDPRAVYVGSLDAAEPPRLLLAGGSNAKYAQGHIFFLRGPTLMVQRLDTDAFELLGTPTPIADNLDITGSQTRAVAAFSVSNTGLLAFLGTRGADSSGTARLLWFDRTGRVLEELGGPMEYADVSVSPNGTRAAVAIRDLRQTGRDIWTYDIARKLGTRFTFNALDELAPVWSPDGSRIVFSSRRPAGMELYQKPSTGAGGDELLLAGDGDLFPASWSRDGRFILYQRGPVLSPGQRDLWVLPMTGDRKPFPLLQTEFNESSGQFSPDGRWVAYASNESGRSEIYIVSFPQASGKWQVSNGGGNFPRWRGDGREMYFLATDLRLVAVEVDGNSSEFVIGAPRPLFDVPPISAPVTGVYDVSPDGQRFLVASRPRDATLAPITLVVNWPAMLRGPGAAGDVP